MIPIKNNNAKEIDDTQKGEVFLPHLFLFLRSLLFPFCSFSYLFNTFVRIFPNGESQSVNLGFQLANIPKILNCLGIVSVYLTLIIVEAC